MNPFTHRIKVSTRIRNHETAQAKVNDADGNPIEIAAVVVWQVHDTAKAIYSVDEYTKFVAIQTETAVRHAASSYPYTSHREVELSLRDNAEEITACLSAEIANRVAPAGVQIIQSRLTRLSYAPEIAQAMLRQQQATAVVGARQKIVEGAAGMVQAALQRRLEEQSVVAHASGRADHPAGAAAFRSVWGRDDARTAAMRVPTPRVIRLRSAATVARGLRWSEGTGSVCYRRPGPR